MIKDSLDKLQNGVVIFFFILRKHYNSIFHVLFVDKYHQLLLLYHHVDIPIVKNLNVNKPTVNSVLNVILVCLLMELLSINI